MQLDRGSKIFIYSEVTAYIKSFELHYNYFLHLQCKQENPQLDPLNFCGPLSLALLKLR